MISSYLWVNRNSKGRGVAKEKVFKEKCGAKLEFPEGWGYKPLPKKNLHGRGEESFSGTTHWVEH